MSYIYSYKAGTISLKRARVYAFKDLEKYANCFYDIFDAGIITREEARPYAFKHLEHYPGYVEGYFNVGIITRREARPFALKALGSRPTAFSDDFRAKVLSKYNNPVLDQMERDGIDVESMIDPDLKFLLDS